MSLFNFLSALLQRGPQLTPEQQARLRLLERHRSIEHRPLSEQRFVVLDLETSGLNLERDIVLSIGAVMIEQGAIQFGRQFECTLKRNVQVNESVLIHGIAPSELANGLPAPEALLSFMEYAGDCVFLAYHAPFDQRMLTRALQDELGYKLEHPFFDLADLAPMLMPHVLHQQTGLDFWIDYFNLNMPQRHHASADALATAEIALILFSRAQRMGLDDAAEIAARLNHWKRSRQAARNTMF